MTEKDKELLLKDLCARLPYGVKASYYGAEEECECVDIIDGIYPFDNEVSIGQYALEVEAVKPYLLPLSSMTEEQRKEYHELLYNPENGINIDYFDWCHKNHFDCRHLIPMGLANDATGLGIYK